MGRIDVTPEVSEALADGTPVVALESALVTHGFAPPSNLEIAQRMRAAVREAGAVPATVALLDGSPHIGLSTGELERLASDRTARKVSLRDLPPTLAEGATGGTTVAATMVLAHRVGIRVLATGGIGGVHRGHVEDVSADLAALASISLIVVCSGAKAILDLPRTIEVLETRGVPVVGYGTDEFPAFYGRHSGLGVDAEATTPEQVARMALARDELGLPAALLVCVPVPETVELPAEEAEEAIVRAVEEAEATGVSGKDLTPFLLARMVALTGGRARRANEALLVNNAAVAAAVARALAGAG